MRPTVAEIERISHDCILAEDTVLTINSPVIDGRQRASGLRFADPRTQSLWHALILFRLFRSGDLRHRLRLHGMIQRLPKSFRYRIAERGLRATLFFTRLYNRLLRPGIAAALSGHAAIDTPLRRAFDNVQIQLDAAINQARLAP